ncbi:hypothetical protein [Corallococcus exiguus]|nr:hypothetical protein [Corallococcus exiguus]
MTFRAHGSTSCPVNLVINTTATTTTTTASAGVGAVRVSVS